MYPKALYILPVREKWSTLNPLRKWTLTIVVKALTVSLYEWFSLEGRANIGFLLNFTQRWQELILRGFSYDVGTQPRDYELTTSDEICLHPTSLATISRSTVYLQLDCKKAKLCDTVTNVKGTCRVGKNRSTNLCKWCLGYGYGRITNGNRDRLSPSAQKGIAVVQKCFIGIAGGYVRMSPGPNENKDHGQVAGKLGGCLSCQGTPCFERKSDTSQAADAQWIRSPHAFELDGFPCLNLVNNVIQTRSHPGLQLKGVSMLEWPNLKTAPRRGMIFTVATGQNGAVILSVLPIASGTFHEEALARWQLSDPAALLFHKAIIFAFAPSTVTRQQVFGKQHEVEITSGPEG
ncbi:hypothetical protein GGX14DRAFT_400437 [Mycena pura]|uniref:Uncharacterized protein n=1 Tax=Mycena pura TaxID=153505 RepID=A0AAD6V4T7_9AGAR|nr:hypothetical protein GGX14DRAFT_400437 [Mycena pura]